jgi:hypothetical protein
MHHVEAWNEAVCAGAWGERAARAGEWLRQALDLEHWAAFDTSFARLTRLIEHVGTGVHGPPPASVIVLSGDVHHAYLAEIAFRRDVGMQSAVFQATCSAVRNTLDAKERRVLRGAGSKVTAVVGRALARAAGVKDPGVRWRLLQDPTFDPQIGTLSLDQRSARLRIEKTIAAEWEAPRLHVTLERELAAVPAAGAERRPTAPSKQPETGPEPALI